MENDPTRRSVLTGLAAGAVGLAGCVGEVSTDPGRTGGSAGSTTSGGTEPNASDGTTGNDATGAASEGPPVVDAGSDDPDRNVTVDVEVVDADGSPVSDEPVVLQDRGGTPDARFGRTGPEGKLQFVESVGPPPCNRQLLVLPARDQRATLGCNEGGSSVDHTFEVEGKRQLPSPRGDGPPVVGEGSGDRKLRIELTALDREGEPLANEPVLLQDRGGTPDARFGVTDSKGRIVFVEGVGPPPCNRQLAVLPERDYRMPLGCNDGGKTVERTLQLGKQPERPEKPDRPPEKPDPRQPDDPKRRRPKRGRGLTMDAGVDPEGAPTVGEGSGDRKLRIVMAVRDGDQPVANEPVVLKDRGGTPDDRKAKTGPEGRLVFVEGVGPPPCNRQWIVLPERGRKGYLGCNNGGKTLNVAFDLSKPPESGDGDGDASGDAGEDSTAS